MTSFSLLFILTAFVVVERSQANNQTAVSFLFLLFYHSSNFQVIVEQTHLLLPQQKRGRVHSNCSHFSFSQGEPVVNL